jgi:hypothetical protein
VPYLSCPSCRLTHYESASSIASERSCPRCQRKLGIRSILFESTTLPEARAELARIAASGIGVPQTVMPHSVHGRDAAAAG